VFRNETLTNTTTGEASVAAVDSVAATSMIGRLDDVDDGFHDDDSALPLSRVTLP